MSLKTRRVLLVVAVGAIAFEPFLFAGSFAGDAQVHLVFAESAAHGRFFEFNPGERVSGETSPGYMLLGAALFHLMPARWVPVTLKFVGLVAWYLLCWLVYQTATRLFAADGENRHVWPAVAAMTAALIPGSVYNANVGMENGLFAAVVWWWVDLADRWSWFRPADSRTEERPLSRELALATLLGVSCWLRPEGFVLAGVAHAFRYRTARPPVRLWLAGLSLVGTIGLASVVFQFACTGDWVATSILSRRVLTMSRSLPLGPLAIDPTFAGRLLLYFPLTACFVWGVPRRWIAGSELERFLLTLLALFFVFYTCITGSAQLSRYVIFLMPIFAIGAAHGARALWQSGKRNQRLLLGAAAFVFGVTNVAESWYRRRHYSQDLLTSAMTAPAERQERTDALLDDLGNPSKRPVVLALEAVQARYELDGRITVRSLDGRVDRALLAFVHDGAIDHVGYLKARGVDYLFKPPSYNRNLSVWSLANLATLEPGEAVQRDGLRLRRLTSAAFAVETTESPAR